MAMRPLALPLAVAAILLAGSSALGLRLAGQLLGRPYDVAIVPGGSAARIAALGHRTLLSDLYWLSTVQYVGEPRADERGWEKLLPLVDLVTDLDPRHGYAYQTAGIVLSSVGRLDESDRILEKGIARGPPYWTFPYYLAFNSWFYRGDYERAAAWAERAARTPGASPNVSQLALALRSKSGSPDLALQMIDELRGSVKDEETRRRLDEQYALGVVERDAQMLERAAARFEAAEGRPLGTLIQLVRGGYLERIPEDPFGGSYEWHPEERKVRSSRNPFRFSVRDPPQRAGGSGPAAPQPPPERR
jgi:tetratricopeptide (TPR) repeat protein